MGSVRSVPLDAGPPSTNLIGDAQVMSKWGRMSIDANPDMMKARRQVRSLEPECRFCFPTAIDFDPETDRIVVNDMPAESATDIPEGSRLKAVRASRSCRPPWLPKGAGVERRGSRSRDAGTKDGA